MYINFKNTVFRVCVLVILFTSCANKYTPASQEQLTQSDIYNIEGKTKAELYVSANEWMAENFVNAKSVIQYSDKEAGKIVGKYIDNSQEGSYYYTYKSVMTISFKDGRIKVDHKDAEFYKRHSLDFTDEDRKVFKPFKSIEGMVKIKKQWTKINDQLVAHLSNAQEDW